MRISKLAVSLGYTVNLGNYESQRFDVSVEGIVDEGENVPEAARMLRAHASSQLADLMLPAIRDLHFKRVEEIERRIGVRFAAGSDAVEE